MHARERFSGNVGSTPTGSNMEDDTENKSNPTAKAILELGAWATSGKQSWVKVLIGAAVFLIGIGWLVWKLVDYAAHGTSPQ